MVPLLRLPPSPTLLSFIHSFTPSFNTHYSLTHSSTFRPINGFLLGALPGGKVPYTYAAGPRCRREPHFSEELSSPIPVQPRLGAGESDLSALGPSPSVVLKSSCPFPSKLLQVLAEGGWEGPSGRPVSVLGGAQLAGRRPESPLLSPGRAGIDVFSAF